MIETTLNALQLVTTGLCTAAAGRRAVRSGKRVWLLMALASGVFFLGDLYWQLYLVFYQMTPRYSFIPDLSWYACYIFLLLTLLELRGNRPPAPRSRLLWLLPVFTAGMCVFYLQWGEWLSNIVTAVLMSLLLWHAADCLTLWKAGDDGRKRFFAWTILIFCTVEYAVWTSSCFWMGDTLSNPYFWFDALLSLCFLILPSALRKAVGV